MHGPDEQNHFRGGFWDTCGTYTYGRACTHLRRCGAVTLSVAYAVSKLLDTDSPTKAAVAVISVLSLAEASNLAVTSANMPVDLRCSCLIHPFQP